MDLDTDVGTTNRPRSSSGTPPPAKKARLAEENGSGDEAAAAAAGPSSAPSTVKSGGNQGQKGKGKKKRKIRRPPPPEPGTSEDVILRDVIELLGGEEAVKVLAAAGKDWESPLEKGQVLEVVVEELSSNGEAIARVPSTVSPNPWAILVPFALPGETVRVRVYANVRLHSLADLVEVVIPNEEMRDNSLMLSYDTQLQLKQRVVEKAYKNFSGLPPSLVPSILPTIASPKTYGYRTKITPHFDLPPMAKRKESDDPKKLAIGFGEKGRRKVMDIEECVIATPVLNQALPGIRENVRGKLHTYKRGATLLLRDSFQRPESDEPAAVPIDTAPNPPQADPQVPLDAISVEPPTATTSEQDGEAHVCITDYKATVRERVGDTVFEFPAGSFFQNNSSVLSPLVEYVRSAIFDSTSTPSSLTHLVDTYCGSGLFAISLAPHFEHVAGVEISQESIASAKHNAALNNLPPPSTSSTPAIRTKSLTFLAGKSETIFSSVSDFPSQNTVIIIDPPRKGCDKLFLQQLVAFKPAKLVYVSCNVHTQARDLGMLVELMKEVGEGKETYVIESLRGFDLFPQTAHVESVAVLRLVQVEA
ncbi:tRNA(m5U54)methyltransferase [Tulasnella sp. 424]|nr:tRNA(m5U54)methyltransferase [Tulasnella sp. 424]KAG8976813.1 tRNA(m5U54)methyltransferase [Tulasnella sp. 425]